MLKTTPLNAIHRAEGARMVAFSGWEMPLHYGSQIEEHQRVRLDCGVFDVSHMLVIDVLGGGSRDFLSYVLANNIERIAARPGKALYSCLLNPAGGVLDDLIVYCCGAARYRLVVNCGSADQDYAWLIAQRDACAPGVEIEARRDLAIVAVQGPDARAKVQSAVPGAQAAANLAYFSAVTVGDSMLARTGYTGEDGYEIILPAAAAIPLWQRLRGLGVAAAGLGARDTLRLEAGLNLYGQDMDDTTTPLETGLAWTVDMESARDFIGKRALQDARPQRRALGLLLLDDGVMRAHQKVTTAQGAGEITSGGFGPTLGRSIALARLPVAVEPDAESGVEIRGKLLRARVVRPPFVRHGKIRIALGEPR